MNKRQIEETAADSVCRHFTGAAGQLCVLGLQVPVDCFRCKFFDPEDGLTESLWQVERDRAVLWQKLRQLDWRT